METPIEKGNKLEDAVELIERSILSINPSLKKGILTIERKKIISNPRQEVDLHVTIDQGKEYKSIFIFECKNWESKISNKEIIIFSDKIKSFNAQKGFFVAKDYSKDAIIQAKKDERLVLLYVKDNPLDVSLFPQSLEVITFSNFQILNMGLFQFGLKDDSKSKQIFLNAKETFVKHRNERKSLLDFIDSYIREVSDEKILKEKQNTKFDIDKEYELEHEKEFLFNKGELYIDIQDLNGKDMEKIILKIKFKFKIVQTKLLFKFDILTRGSFVEYEPVKIGSQEIKLSMTFTPT